MTGYIINPLGLSGITIKIFVRSTDASRGQEDFRRIVFNGQCAELARTLYRVINADGIRLRAAANESAPIRSTLVKCSFVKTMQINNEWAEVITPENRQGWIKRNYLAIIE
ncbi:SH3 domain-containing protein [Chitinophaga sp. YR627]|uniref:SH3 domain-containing protein n=1 Tax=Chitinophaga sp. YR627 TaxID=1881041 RepID=UPI000B7CFE95|nr:SH3 domain-containing protein [Chitinophaga sp. YR627]